MVYLSRVATALLTAAVFAKSTIAHPGHDVREEVAERAEYFQSAKRNLAHCSEKLAKRGLEDKQTKRREAAIAALRKERDLKARAFAKRSIESVTNTSHLSTLNITDTTKSSGIWGVEDYIYSNSSCLLSPEGEVGPYYVTGEYIRKDIREDQPGFDVLVDAQFIDVDTCEPVPNVMWDIWHCNATGVYAGVVASGNGNGEEDPTNLNNTFLRGLQPSDGDGVAQFLSIFPGHYSGRATHMHVVAHTDGTVLSNGTYTGGSIAHIGQIFFDQDLITQVNALEPYVSNTIAITENVDDNVVADEVANDADPFLNYVLLGDTVEDGIFAWITLGINVSASYTYSAASKLTADGGVALSSSSTGGEGGSGNGTDMGNSTLPSGAAPSASSAA